MNTFRQLVHKLFLANLDFEIIWAKTRSLQIYSLVVAQLVLKKIPELSLDTPHHTHTHTHTHTPTPDPTSPYLEGPGVVEERAVRSEPGDEGGALHPEGRQEVHRLRSVLRDGQNRHGDLSLLREQRGSRRGLNALLRRTEFRFKLVNFVIPALNERHSH